MQSATATRTVTQSETNVNPSIRYDPTVFRTIPGILKCTCVVSNWICFIHQFHSLGSFANDVYNFWNWINTGLWWQIATLNWSCLYCQTDPPILPLWNYGRHQWMVPIHICYVYSYFFLFSLLSQTIAQLEKNLKYGIRYSTYSASCVLRVPCIQILKAEHSSIQSQWLDFGLPAFYWYSMYFMLSKSSSVFRGYKLKCIFV